MIGQDPVDRARIILLDPNGTRWPDPEMIIWVSDGQREIGRRRPDALYTADHPTGLSITADITALTETLDVSDFHVGAMTDYICWRCFRKDSENVKSARRAKEHLDDFMRQML